MKHEYIGGWSLMDSMIADLVKIIKAKKNALAKEQALMIYLRQLTCQLIALALKQADDGLVKMMRQKGYCIDRKSPRNVALLCGNVQLKRRRYVAAGKKACYPLDKLLGWTKYQRYSPLVLRGLLLITTKMTYRQAAWVVKHLTNLPISPTQLNHLVRKQGQAIKQKQEKKIAEQTEFSQRKQVDALYLEGDGVCFKGTQHKQLEFSRFQICEGEMNLTYQRRKRIKARDFVSLHHAAALKEAQAYLTQHDDLHHTVVLSKADGGAGYQQADFDDLIGKCQRHEHFLDRFHLHQKIRDRLRLFPKLRDKLIKAVNDYDQSQVQLILDTVESQLVGELDTPENQANLRRLRVYLHKHWADIKPWKLRHLEKFFPALGSCESNHRLYTYRMKGQGRFWTEDGARALLTIIACQKNGDLDYWLAAKLKQPQVTALKKERYTEAARQALKKVKVKDEGVKHGAIKSYVAGNNYLQKLNEALNWY